jgi:Na+-driven multidrug efflux pump
MLQPYSTQLTAMERLKAIMYIGIITQGLNIILNFILIPDQIGSVRLFGLGAVGSAISLLSSTLIATLFYRIYLVKRTGLTINYWIFIYMLIAIISTIIPVSLPGISKFILPVKLLISFILSGILYFGILRIFKLFNLDDMKFYLDFIKISKNIEYFKSEINEKHIE